MKITIWYLVIGLFMGSMPIMVLTFGMFDFNDMNFGMWDTETMKQEVRQTWNQFKTMDCGVIKNKIDNYEFSEYQPHKMISESYLAEDYYTHECLDIPRISETQKFYELRKK